MSAINRRCPRSGRPVSADSLTRYRGLTVGFCNPGCRDDFAARPEACEGDRRYFDALIAERDLDREGQLPTLEGPRVRLRWLQPEDVPALYAIYSDAEVLRYWSHGPFGHLDEAAGYRERIVQYFREGTLFQWGVARCSDDAVIGTVTLNLAERANARADIGYALARAHWGAGLGREAVALALDHAFGPLALGRVGADVDPRNSASLRLLAKLGFREEGRLRETWRIGGGVQDSVVLSLLAREWRARSGAAAALDRR